MILGVFCVFDSKALTYGMPFFTQNRGAAQRGISLQLRSDSKSMLAQYPEDFALYDMGTYDDDTGVFNTHAPVFVVGVSELIEGGSNEQQP